MKRRNILKSKEGFTLIEIIAVLVILGILAAVAIPKFLDLQDEAREKALEGLIAAGQSQLAMEYAKEILNRSDEDAAWGNLDTGVCANVSKDGFAANTTLTCAREGNTVTLTASDDTSSTTGFFNRPE